MDIERETPAAQHAGDARFEAWLHEQLAPDAEALQADAEAFTRVVMAQLRAHNEVAADAALALLRQSAAREQRRRRWLLRGAGAGLALAAAAAGLAMLGGAAPAALDAMAFGLGAASSAGLLPHAALGLLLSSGVVAALAGWWSASEG
jgi:hypothetical protein